MSENRNTAKRLLVHYVVILFEQSDMQFDADNVSELEQIVDNIVDAAVEEVMERIANPQTKGAEVVFDEADEHDFWKIKAGIQ